MHTISVTMETSSGTEFVSVPLLLVKEEEPQDDPEMAEANFSLHDSSIVAEPDPMNLLDPVNECVATPDSEMGSGKGSDPSAGGHSKEVWKEWMAEYPWLLHEDEDEHYGYCLYCNNKLNFKFARSPRFHLKSRCHRENAENYLAFKASEESANLSTSVENIKQEFGTDSNISAIKYKRMSQTEPLFNFNWQRWQQQHPWLERDKDENAYGYCKYCKMRLYAEFGYMRQRHEEGNKHKSAAREYLRNEEINSSNQDLGIGSLMHSIMEEGEDDGHTESRNEGATDSTDDRESQVAPSKKRKRSRQYTGPYLEIHPNRQTARCKLCNVTMIAGNFSRHLRSQAHLATERMSKKKANDLKVKEEFNGKARNWKVYAKIHPWLIADPDDPNTGYCKYCKRRLLCAIHPMKRLIHEKSDKHIHAERLYKSALSSANVKGKHLKGNQQESEQEEANENEGDEEENEEEQEVNEEAEDEDAEEEAEANNEDSEEQSETATEPNNEEADSETNEDTESNDQPNNSKITRVLKTSDEWYNMYPWCKRNLEDPDYYYCVYCKTNLTKSNSRLKHEKGKRHLAAMKEYLLENAETPDQYQDKRKTYPWLVQTKRNPQYVFCRYCRIRFSSTHSRTKHEATKRHIDSAKQFLHKDAESQSNAAVAVQPSSGSSPRKSQAPVVAKVKPLMAQRPLTTKVNLLRSKFPWVIFKRNELQPNYGYCKYCEMRVYLPTEKFAAKHQRTLKHNRIRLLMKRHPTLADNISPQTRQSTSAANTDEAAATPVNDVSYDWTSLNEAYPWLLPDKQKERHYAYCQYCDVRINIQVNIAKDRHQATQKHRAAQKVFLKNNENSVAEDQTAAEPAEAVEEDADMVIVEDDEQSVKSEPMDEDDVLEYLLQRSELAKTSAAMETDDRQKIKDRARRLTTAHLELMRLSRNINDSITPKKAARYSMPAGLFHTSAAIAALLSPPKVPAPSPQSATPALPIPRNNIELFFDSVCESVKTLPSDLAAEGKIKIMQLVAELETRALQRSQSTDLQPNSSATQIVAMPLTPRSACSPVKSNDVASSTTNGSTSADVICSPAKADATDPNIRSVKLSTTQISKINASEHCIKRMQLNPAAHVGVKPTEAAATAMPRLVQAPQSVLKLTPSPGTASQPQRIQFNNIQSTISNTSIAYQRPNAQQVARPLDTMSTQRSQQQQQPLNSSAVIDNGYRRIQLGTRPQTATATSVSNTPPDLGFRRIHLPYKVPNTQASTHSTNYATINLTKDD